MFHDGHTIRIDIPIVRQYTRKYIDVRQHIEIFMCAAAYQEKGAAPLLLCPGYRGASKTVNYSNDSDFGVSVGRPDAHHASNPPAILLTFGKPSFCRASAASAARPLVLQ